MTTPSARWARLLSCVPLVLGILSITGCERGIKRIPVSGNVTLDDQPLQDGLVMFNPDDSKGNTLRVACAGRVKDGRYTLVTSAVTRTDTGSGAPLGWFKITLSTDLPGMKPVKVAPKYQRPESSPISIEIVDEPAPGAYDVKFTSK